VTDLVASGLERLIAFVAQWWILIVLLAVAVGVRWPPINIRLPTGVKPAHACAAVFLVALVWIVSPVLVHGMPLPWMHDDYSSLLGGELVAQGRTSAPPHPMWRHFEAMHQLQVPRRASKYPPGQLLVLGAGIRLAGQPIVGEWLITALAAAAIYWAALAWAGNGVALIVGLVAAIHPAVLEWGEAYRGGGLAAFGGALVIGSTGRLMRVPRARDACLFGAGAVLLAIARPYEGLVLTVACAAFLLRRPKQLLFAALIVAAGLAGLAMWNRSVTGDPLLMPYVAYERQYAGAPLFVFQKPRPQPAIGNAEMAMMNRVYSGQVRRARQHPFAEMARKAADMGGFWFGHRSAWLLFLALILLQRSRDKMPLVVIAAVFMSALLLINGWLLPHYLAPAAAAAWILLVSSTVTLSKRPRGSGLTVLIALLFVANACGAWWKWASGSEPHHERDRRAIEQSLRADGKRDLVIVAQDVFDMVYNHADIDAQDVVWARDLGASANASLIRYYRDRVVWYLAKDAGGRLVLRTAGVPPTGPANGLNLSLPSSAFGTFSPPPEGRRDST
jgi:hypothetical protein